MTTDARDTLLQAHAPAIMVPRFGALQPLEKSGHRYLVAEDGVWLEVKRPWLHARLPIASENHWAGDREGFHRMPFGHIERSIVYAFGADDLDEMQRRFRQDAERALPNECAAWGVYSESTRRLDYRPLVAIEASAGGIEFHRPRLVDGEHLAIDIHSHGKLDAFFSGTDDEDDAGEVKLSVVVGNVDLIPVWRTRLCVLGLFLESSDAEDRPPSCRVCGCTDAQACPGGCHWVQPDLCSQCVLP